MMLNPAAMKANTHAKLKFDSRGGRRHRGDDYRRPEASRFKRRAAAEPVIGHLKDDHRMGRNYLTPAIA
jgi:hypothetical protein